MPKMNLEPRERIVVIAGAVALAAILLYWGLEGPYEAYKNSAAQVKASRLRLQQAQLWQAEIEDARRKEGEILALLQAQRGGFDLWTHVDRAVKDSQLQGRAEVQSHRSGVSAGSNMSAVELTLTGVSTKELVDLLHRIYDNESFVVLQQLEQLKLSSSGQGLDCRMVLVSPRPS